MENRTRTVLLAIAGIALVCWGIVSINMLRPNPAMAQIGSSGGLLQEIVVQVDTIASLATTTVADKGLVYVRNYASEGDDGGGLFRFDSSGADAADGGMVIAGPTGRFYRILDADDKVSVWFYGDSTTETDWDTEIQAAADYCAANDKVLFFPGGTFNIDATLTIKCDVDANPAAIINVTDRSLLTECAIKVGNGTGAGGATLLFERQIRLPRIKQGDTADEWASGALTTEIGVWLEGIRRSTVWIPEIENFGVGLYVAPDSNYGNNSSRIYVNHIDNCAIGVHISPGDASGWCNENYYYINRISINTAEGTNITGTKMIFLEWPNSGTNQPNHNHFFACDIEGGAGETPAEYEIDCEGSNNSFNYFRLEGTNPSVRFIGLDASNKAQQNVLFMPSHVSDLVFTETNSVGTKFIGHNTNASYAIGAFNPTYGVLRANNTTSDNSPSYAIYSSAIVDLSDDNLAGGASDSDKAWWMTANGLEGYDYGLTNPTIDIRNQTGDIYLGNGSSPAAGYLTDLSGSAIGVVGEPLIVYNQTFGVGSTDISPLADIDVGGAASLVNIDGVDDIVTKDDVEVGDDLFVIGDLHVAGQVFDSLDYTDEALSATKVLGPTSPRYQKLDCNGAARSVLLPAEASSDGLVFVITNITGATYDLTVRDDADAVTIGTLNPLEMATFVCDGTTWIHMGIVTITAN